MNNQHGYNRGFPPGGYVINGSTVTISVYSVWNGLGWSTAPKLKDAKKQAKWERIFGTLAAPKHLK